MKNILPGLTAFFAGIFSLHAQNLYTTTFYGGDADAGTIIKFMPATNSSVVLKNFDYTNGANPYGDMIQASDGKLYGMTSVGGTKNVGIIYSFDPSSSIYTKLMDFDSINGANPHGNLMQAGNGKLYGMTYSGGSKGYGVIFSFDPATATYTKLKDFTNSDGANPSGSLLQATDGKLYGTTDFGGRFALVDRFSWGVIFSFDTATSVYTVLKDFNESVGEGAVPSGNLIQAGNGKLYGMTQSGGGNNYTGVIFSFDPSSSTYTRLWAFDNTTATGNTPSGSLVQAGNGKLYGLTTSGLAEARYGVIFSYDLLTSAYKELHDFDNANGIYPYGSLLQGGDGKLYGGTLSGGANGDGVIFCYDPASSLFKKLSDFNGTNGAHPYSTFIEAPKTSIALEMCSKGNTDLISNISGSTYQWQLSTDGQAFSNINDNVNITGTHTSHLQLINIPSSWYGYHFRCSVNSLFSNVYKLKFTNYWMGTVSNAWEDPANWSCGVLPDSVTNVIVNSAVPFEPVINTNNICKSIILNPAINLTVTNGHRFIVTGK
jgi:uncharacterized repeat protein (TIGR03803 family)